MQLEEILEDLRSGAFTVRTQQTQLESAADRLGRRAFSGLVVGSLIIAGAILLSQGSYWLGGLAAGAGALYATLHTARVWLLGKSEPCVIRGSLDRGSRRARPPVGRAASFRPHTVRHDPRRHLA